MKKKFALPIITAICIFFAACSSKETASSIAQKWCDLNGKVFKAEEGSAKDLARTAQKDFEKKMEEKYKDDEAFMKEVEKEVEKCEDASEGK
ncbi:MAG: hypothetical protein IPH34_00525 [Chitinophagaceae bacterium]|nr:hypothetical protein [Chitinophagaceae bacterium]MBK8311470.1 hypothetical protein [Chitinophagaceae bacterium]MBK8605941.1 hypothetical protein [Chitinophagaceae bacterium]MBP6477924.1 hypothetical protein [Chitinophagaceae bacterium]MBP7108367.1 hypothetical protein [Chitinophagaceae bacterium]